MADDLELPTTQVAQKAVYDPNGKRHLVSHLNANDLVQHLGWSRVAPVVIRDTAPAGDEGKTALTAAVAASSIGAAPPIAPANPPVDTMTRDELVAEATKHGIESVDAFSDQDLRDAIQVERGE